MYTMTHIDILAIAQPFLHLLLTLLEPSMCASVCMHMYAFVPACRYTHAYIHLLSHTLIRPVYMVCRVCTCVGTCILEGTQKPIQNGSFSFNVSEHSMQLCPFTVVRSCIHAYVYTHRHTHTHTHACTCTYTQTLTLTQVHNVHTHTHGPIQQHMPHSPSCQHHCTPHQRTKPHRLSPY